MDNGIIYHYNNQLYNLKNGVVSLFSTSCVNLVDDISVISPSQLKEDNIYISKNNNTAWYINEDDIFKINNQSIIEKPYFFK